LAESLHRALTDRNLAERLIAAGNRRADDFSMTTLACRYAEIYRTVAARATEPKAISPWLLSPRLRRRNRMMA
jgi:hypothetical protein